MDNYFYVVVKTTWQSGENTGYSAPVGVAMSKESANAFIMGWDDKIFVETEKEFNDGMISRFFKHQYDSMELDIQKVMAI